MYGPRWDFVTEVLGVEVRQTQGVCRFLKALIQVFMKSWLSSGLSVEGVIDLHPSHVSSPLVPRSQLLWMVAFLTRERLASALGSSSWIQSPADQS